jgi:hypothetical protein
LALGAYNFENVGNTDVVLLRNLSVGSIYAIDSVTATSNVEEGSWLEGAQAVNNAPRFSLYQSRSNSRGVFSEPFPVGSYLRDLPNLSYFRAFSPGTNLLAKCFGSIDQSAGMVGNPTLLLQVQLVIYEIIDMTFISQFSTQKNPIGGA